MEGRAYIVRGGRDGRKETGKQRWAVIPLSPWGGQGCCQGEHRAWPSHLVANAAQAPQWAPQTASLNLKATVTKSLNSHGEGGSKHLPHTGIISGLTHRSGSLLMCPCPTSCPFSSSWCWGLSFSWSLSRMPPARSLGKLLSHLQDPLQTSALGCRAALCAPTAQHSSPSRTYDAEPKASFICSWIYTSPNMNN